MLALVQDWRRQYGSRVDIDMFASHGTNLLIVRPAHTKFDYVSQLLDLQTLVLVGALLSLAPQKALTFAVFPSFSASSRPLASNFAQHSPV